MVATALVTIKVNSRKVEHQPRRPLILSSWHVWDLERNTQAHTCERWQQKTVRASTTKT